jgi:hypothetical protein
MRCDVARSSSVNRRRKIYTGGKTTYDARATCQNTRTTMRMMVAQSSPERELARRWHSASRKETTVKVVGDGVLLLHKQEEDIRNYCRHLVNNEWHGLKVLTVGGGWRSHDRTWRM